MPQPIPDPLWDLMLSTNDCYPGCSCEADRFEITSQRVASWVSRFRDKRAQALVQLEALLACPPANLEDLSTQTNVSFVSRADAVEWFDRWLCVLRSANSESSSS